MNVLFPSLNYSYIFMYLLISALCQNTESRKIHCAEGRVHHLQQVLVITWLTNMTVGHGENIQTE